jgi:hypothetical protein
MRRIHKNEGISEDAEINTENMMLGLGFEESNPLTVAYHERFDLHGKFSTFDHAASQNENAID